MKKSRIINEPGQHLQIVLHPAHNNQSSSNDIAEVEFQQYMQLNNDNVSETNEQNKEEIEKQTEDSSIDVSI